MRVVFGAIALALATHPAHADDVEAAAQVHLDRGVAAFERKDFVTAHAELEAAQQLVPDKPNPYRWLALTEVQLSDCVRARPNIEAFLARVAEDDPRRPEMLRLRELCARTGGIEIRSTPRAQLRIDGVYVGDSPYRSGSIAVGPHTLVAEADGYERFTKPFEVRANGEHAMTLTLQRAQPRSRWWLVPAIAGAAILATGAIYLATRDSDDPTLPGLVCDDSGCRPGAR